MTTHIFKKPDKYSKNNALQYNFAKALLNKITFNSDSRILDIGCGDGTITNEMAQVADDGCVIGTDISSYMTEFASKQYIKQQNLRFLQMDANKNIFREQFDILTSFNCLHWVKEQGKAIAGIAKAACSGAQIALLLSHKKSLYHLVLDKICSSSKWRNYFKDFVSPRLFFELDSYRTMLVEAGLGVIEITEEEMTYTYSSKKQLIDFFNASGSELEEIPELKKEEFLKDFATEFLTQVKHHNDKEISVSFYCLQVIARKL